MYSQPGIFNVLDYGIFPGSLGSPGGNATNLQNLIYTVQSLGGGTILFPSQYEVGGTNHTEYKFDGPIGVGPTTSPSPVSIIFSGTCQGTESQTTLLVQNASDLFQIDTGSPSDDDDPLHGGDEHIGGITFQDLSIQYNGQTSGTAINVIHGENVRIVRVVFVECPQAVTFADTLQCSMFQCTVHNQSTSPSPACVTLGTTEPGGLIAKEIHIDQCTFLSQHAGGIGFAIGGAEHIRMMNCRLEGYTEGINIVPGAVISGGQNTLKHHFGNVTVYTANPSGPTGPAVTIQPQGPQNISEVVFAECTFEPASMAASAGPGVYIDEGAYGGTITDIRFVSCKVTRWTGPGLQIDSGSNIEVNGGLYAANASGDSLEGPPGGISIMGAASAIRIIGAACIGTYPYIQNDGAPTEPPSQNVGVYIAGAGASNVIIDHCDLTGNSDFAVQIAAGGLNVTDVFVRNCNASGYGTSPANAIDIVGEVSNVQITYCAGYNDRAAILATSMPSGTFSNVTFGYYGPIAFYVKGAGHVFIDGVDTELTDGGYTLVPGETAKVNSTATYFLTVGK